MAGIKEGRTFRDAVLSQRDLMIGREEDRQLRDATDPTLAMLETTVALLEDIRDTLRRIENRIPRS